MNHSEEVWGQGYGYGYTIVKGLFSHEHLGAARKAIIDYMAANVLPENASGKFLPDFIGVNALAAVTALKDDPHLLEVLTEIFGTDSYRFCGHCDIGINRVVSGWHKDILNGAYLSYQKVSPWATGPAGETYKIVKVGIYLQDHSGDNNALQVVPGSHLEERLDTTNPLRLKPAFGDCIIFDQRITHRGMERAIKATDPRIMVTFGFGADNFFTDSFEAGTRARQDEQLRAFRAATESQRPKTI